MSADICAQVSACLRDTLTPFGDTPVAQAMRHATEGGKRVRARLVMEAARMHDVPDASSVFAAAAIEALHAYSLVHDDMPCMDDDAERRGRPTVHVKWDEVTAVLAGDALQSLAFELVCRPEVGAGDVRADLALSLARAAGGQGMVLGQALDMAAENSPEPLSIDQITRLQAGKTGALIEWSGMAGARLAGADTGPLGAYARALGLAFQIRDDLIDATGDAAAAGKAVGKDAAAGKATFVSLLGLDGAKRRAADLVAEACDALHPYADRAAPLRAIAHFVIERQN